MDHTHKTDGNEASSIHPVVQAYKKDVDRTLIRENLRLTVDQGFQELMKLQRFGEDLRACRKRG